MGVPAAAGGTVAGWPQPPRPRARGGHPRAAAAPRPCLGGGGRPRIRKSSQRVMTVSAPLATLEEDEPTLGPDGLVAASRPS